MSKTENFRRQHHEIRQVVRQLSAFLDRAELVRDADQVRLLLSELAGKLGVHLAMEDHALYPRLIHHEDAAVAALAAMYAEEMGGIKSAFMGYAHKWRAAKAIEAAPQEFIDETRGIVEALTERMTKEDAELYSLVDKQS